MASSPEESQFCKKSSFTYLTFVGEKNLGWFSTDLDSAGINIRVEGCNCKVSNALLYKLEARFYDAFGKYAWYDLDKSCLSTGVEMLEATNAQIIKISPNPVSSSFKIEYDEDIRHLKLIDASNKVYFCRHYPTREKEKTIDIPDLKKGLYFLVVNGEYGVKVVKE